MFNRLPGNYAPYDPVCVECERCGFEFNSDQSGVNNIVDGCYCDDCFMKLNSDKKEDEIMAHSKINRTVEAIRELSGVSMLVALAHSHNWPHEITSALCRDAEAVSVRLKHEEYRDVFAPASVLGERESEIIRMNGASQ